MRHLLSLLFVFGCSQANQSAPTPPKKDNAKPVEQSAALVKPPPESKPVSAPTTVKLVAPTSVNVVEDSEALDDAVIPAVKASERLVELPGASLPLKTFAMSGPFKDYSEYCKASAKTLDAWVVRNQEQLYFDDINTYKTDTKVVCPTKKKPKKREYEDEESFYVKEILYDEKPATGPYQEIKVLHHQHMFSEMPPGHASVELSVQLKGGWYGVQVISYSPEWVGAAAAGYNDRTVKSMEVIDAIPGGEPELVFVITSYDDKGGRVSADGFHSKDLLFICGLGSAGAPSCYAPIRVAESEETNIYAEDDEEKLKKKISTSWKLKEPYFKDGQLSLSPEDEKAEIPKRIKALFGTHPLSFP